MTTMEIDDYDSDSKFGHWLREQRITAGLNVKQAALKSGISEERIKALEIGYAERGITHSESQKLSMIYKINLPELLSMATSA
jgi:hypothetical protein